MKAKIVYHPDGREYLEITPKGKERSQVLAFLRRNTNEPIGDIVKTTDQFYNHTNPIWPRRIKK